jgi:hypothetical protein
VTLMVAGSWMGAGSSGGATNMTAPGEGKGRWCKDGEPGFESSFLPTKSLCPWCPCPSRVSQCHSHCSAETFSPQPPPPPWPKVGLLTGPLHLDPPPQSHLPTVSRARSRTSPARSLTSLSAWPVTLLTLPVPILSL